MKPSIKPANPCFSSGPCAKYPGWSLDNLKNVLVGRSHRSKDAMARIKEVLELSRELLAIPKDYLIGIVGGSDTAAVEMALWNLLGPKGVDIIHFEEFGKHWYRDIAKQLKLKDIREFASDFGKLPDLSGINSDHDIVFTLNGTTSGVCINNLDFIKNDRKGLTICDATSIIFSIPMDFAKLDITTYSWQKALGGEAQHGIMILSPRAVERLNSHEPEWPIPRLYNLKKNGKFLEEVFAGSTINTPSMLCIEDVLDIMKWCKKIGGANELYARVDRNSGAVFNFIKNSSYLTNLCEKEANYSKTSVCFKITEKWFTSLDEETQRKIMKEICSIVEAENAGFDFNNHKAAPPSFRIWCGPTVEYQNIEILCQWIDYAYHEIQKRYI